MKYTANLNMSKPEYSDPVDIEVINDNFDELDNHGGGNVVSDDGVHGFRIKDSIFEYQEKDGEWMRVYTDGNGVKY